MEPLPPRLAALLADMPLEELAFRSVPVRARSDGWTPERQRGFILRLALGGSVSLAARAVGKTRKSVYRLRDRPDAASFAAAWDKAVGWGRDHMLDVALERALVGEEVPVMRGGRCVAVRHRFDNRLAMVVLNAMDRRTARLAPEADPALQLQRYLDLLEAESGPAENIDELQSR